VAVKRSGSPSRAPSANARPNSVSRRPFAKSSAGDVAVAAVYAIEPPAAWKPVTRSSPSTIRSAAPPCAATR
jgi:hypothetical protein